MIDGKLLYPIGSIYMSIQDTNPSVFFGGTWERIAKGKTLVGVDESDSDFNASSKTGGEKEHKLTIAEMPAHDHNTTKGVSNDNLVLMAVGQNIYGKSGNGIEGGTWVWNRGVPTQGGNQEHNNMQPYYTCYIFVRTA